MTSDLYDFILIIIRSILKQMAYIAGRQQIVIDLPDDYPEDEKEDIQNISSNTYLNNYFHLLGREVN